MKTEIRIIEYSTGNIVKTIDVSGKSERQIDKIESGLNINLDHERFYTDILDTVAK